MKKPYLPVILCVILLFQSVGLACTTILVTKGASADGSVFVSHSDDDELGDQRIIYVPAADHPPGAKRPIYCDAVALGEYPEYNSFIRPRYAGKDRGPGYADPSAPQSIPLGHIPQVAHTYAYFDGNYGIMNEHQLMIGECTNGAKVEPRPEPGKRIFYSAELSRVALERCKSAREAVLLMGRLIDEYGYYGTGETLLVGDPTEGWVFEMCGYDKNGSDGLWVAQKVPDGQIFAAANEFRIRQVIPGTAGLLYTAKLFDVCQAKGWWKPEDGPLDWLKAVSHGEYNHPYYSLRRVWSIFRRLSPSLDLSPWVDDGYTTAYPFAVTPERKLAVKDVMALHRDHYEGTAFDMTQGLAAGPFGSPYRYVGAYDGAQNNVSENEEMWGAWERPISVFYAGYSYVNQGRGWLPDPIGGVSWLGPDKPYLTSYVPFYCGATDLPKAYQTGSTEVFDRGSAWWAFNFVANWAALKFSYMKKDILAEQERLEQKAFAMQPAVEQAALALYEQDRQMAVEYVTDYGVDNANRVVSDWWRLAERLIVKYDDGYVNSSQHMGGEVGYPKNWLQQVGYANGPITYPRPAGPAAGGTEENTTD